MNDGEIDDILKRGAQRLPDVDPELVARLSESVGIGLTAVRPLPPAWIWQAGLAAIVSVIGVGGALILGPRGIQKMNGLEIAAIFSLLAGLVWVAAAVSAAELAPGSRRRLAPWMWCAVCCVALAAVFGVLFTDYGTERFVAQGMVCLKAGLLHALPAMVGAGVLMKRGAAMDSTAAGLATGTLAGLAGVMMLELHCVNFEAPHVMVWHIAVIPLSALIGVAAARLSARL